MKFRQEEKAQGAPNKGQPGFTNIFDAVELLQDAGFGFGEKGAKPGDFYDFGEVRDRTPKNQPINTRKPDYGGGDRRKREGPPRWRPFFVSIASSPTSSCP